MSRSSTTSSDSTGGGTRDGLVRIPEERERPYRKRWVPLAVIALFLLVTVGTGIVDILWPVPLPKLMGEEKFRDQRLRQRVRLVDGTASRLVERDRRLRSRVRRSVSQDYTFALFWLLNEAKETVVVGADKWLYLTSRVQTFPDAHRRIAHTAARLAAVNRGLADKGTRLVVVPVPRKSVIYENHLPRGMEPHPHLDRLILTELSRRGVPAVDLLTPFTHHAAETLYFRNGAHWTPRAEAIAAEHVCRAAGILARPAQRLGELRIVRREPQDLDILRFLGLELSDTKTLRAKRFRPFFANQTVTGYEIIDTETELTADGPAADHMKRIAVFGTSFTALRRFPRFLAHFAGEPVWNGAEPGGHVGRLILSVLRNPRLINPPEILILEMPNSQIMRIGPSRITGEIFTLLQPTRWSAIINHDQFDMARRMHEPVAHTHTRRKIASVRPGVVAHSADGIVAVRFEGRVSGGSLIIEVNSNRGVMTELWHPHQTELIVPIIGYASSAETRILAKAAGGATDPVVLQLDEIQVVTDLDYETARIGRIGSVARDGRGWFEEVRFEQAIPERSFPALELRLAARGPFAGSVEVSVSSGNAARDDLVIQVKKIRRNGIILLNLGSFEGASIEHVRVRGNGRPPKRVITLARILQKGS